MENKITMLKETFTNEKTGADVEGITVIVDGVFKRVLDKVIQDHQEVYPDYLTLLQVVLIKGVNDIIKSLQ